MILAESARTGASVRGETHDDFPRGINILGRKGRRTALSATTFLSVAVSISENMAPRAVFRAVGEREETSFHTRGHQRSLETVRLAAFVGHLFAALSLRCLYVAAVDMAPREKPDCLSRRKSAHNIIKSSFTTRCRLWTTDRPSEVDAKKLAWGV